MRAKTESEFRRGSFPQVRLSWSLAPGRIHEGEKPNESQQNVCDGLGFGYTAVLGFAPPPLLCQDDARLRAVNELFLPASDPDLSDHGSTPYSKDCMNSPSGLTGLAQSIKVTKYTNTAETDTIVLDY